MNMQVQDRKDDIQCLNNFLQNELSAVETYSQCIKKMDDPQIATGLMELQNSHTQRAEMIRQKIYEIGGEPKESSGVWGGFAKLIEGSASLFGEQTAISTLEEGEDRGRDQYMEKSEKLSPDLQYFVNNNLLPEQLRSHDVLNRLQNLVH